MTKEVMQQALEALENAVRYHGIMLMADPPQDAWKYHRVEDNAKQAIAAIKKALALPVQPVQEPVAWRYHPVSPFRDKEGMHKVSDAWKLIDKPNQRDAHSAMCGMEAEPLYTAPPQRKPLTDEQVKELLLIAPVYAPDGVVTRTPFAYRKELLDTALWALRKAEAAHGIKEQS